jgi:hypothetical protein
MKPDTLDVLFLWDAFLGLKWIQLWLHNNLKLALPKYS